MIRVPRKTIQADISIIHVSPIKHPLRQHILVYSRSRVESSLGNAQKLSACFEWEVNQKHIIPELLRGVSSQNRRILRRCCS